MRLRVHIERIVIDVALLRAGEHERFAHELEVALRAALPAHLPAPARGWSIAQNRLDLGARREGALAPALGTALAPHVLQRSR